MSRDKAINFYKRWKTPTRVCSSNAKSPISSPVTMSARCTPQILNRKHVHSARCLRFDPVISSTPLSSTHHLTNGNGLSESNNNNIVKMMPNTDNLADGNVIDSSLMNWWTVGSQTESFRERHIKNSDIEKGLEVVGRQLASQEQLEWREYWDFLDSFVDIRTAEGLDRLEAYLLERSEQAKKEDALFNFAQLYQSLDLVASDQNQQDRSSIPAAEVAPTFIEFQTPYTCVEKSLQVFAKRITKTLIINIKEVTINDMLLGELKRLKSLVASFKVSERVTLMELYIFLYIPSLPSS